MSTSKQFARFPENINISMLRDALVVVIGVGMVGSQIAEGLGRFGVGRLRLIDHDTYEIENTLRHALPIEYLGWNKARALADWLPKQIDGLNAEPIERKIDQSVSWDELDTWFADAHLVVAATDDRQAQRRIGRQTLTREVAAVFPAVYPQRGGGEVVLQLDPEWPCFGCWDYFRADTEQLRGVRALDLDAQPVIFQAEQVCLGALDFGSRQHNLLRGERPGDAPHQLVMIDRIGVPQFGSLTRRDSCPSCAGKAVPRAHHRTPTAPQELHDIQPVSSQPVAPPAAPRHPASVRSSNVDPGILIASGVGVLLWWLFFTEGFKVIWNPVAWIPVVWWFIYVFRSRG
jgi:hypothetical protein